MSRSGVGFDKRMKTIKGTKKQKGSKGRLMYRTVAQLDSVMNILATFFPDLCTRVEMPNRSIEGRPIYACAYAPAAAKNRRGILILGGMHARELMNPDAIADLQLDSLRLPQ